MHHDESSILNRPLRSLVGTGLIAVLLLLAYLLSAASFVSDNGASWMQALILERPPAFRLQAGGQSFTHVANGETWRLLSSLFVHVNGFHLVTNLAAIAVLGRLLEPLVGPLRFIFWFVLGGLLASLTSHLAGVPLSDGASGGAFALLGALGILGLRWKEQLSAADASLVGSGVWVFIGLNLLLSFALPFIDSIGHLAGCGAGFVFGGAVRHAPFQRTRSWIAFLEVSALVGLTGFGVLGWLS